VATLVQHGKTVPKTRISNRKSNQCETKKISIWKSKMQNWMAYGDICIAASSCAGKVGGDWFRARAKGKKAIATSRGNARDTSA
jgi:hypothetical protein